MYTFPMGLEGVNPSIEKKELPPKLVAIFDFDGTLADSLNTVGQIVNELADEYGYEKLNEDEVLRYTSKSARDFLRQDLKLSWLQIPGFATRLRSELSKRITELQPISGMVEVVKELKSRNYKLGIVSSNSEDNIRRFLINNGIDIFDFVSSGSSLLGKARNIKRALSAEGFESEDVVYIGDEIRDREAAQKAGIDVVVVSWGYNSKVSLENSNESIIIDTPSQLLDLLPSLDR